VNTPTSPAQWLYGLLRALPGERACCHRRRRDTSHRLDASIAAPGPHDFAVRPCSVVCACAPEQKRPPHPIPTFGDDGQRPSSGMRRRVYTSDLPNCEAENFCLRGLTRVTKIRTDLPVGGELLIYRRAGRHCVVIPGNGLSSCSSQGCLGSRPSDRQRIS
jgi:hypothetical protein